MRLSCPFQHASVALLVSVGATVMASTHGSVDNRPHDASPRRTPPPEVLNFAEAASAPTPTPPPKLRYRNSKLEARYKGSDTCGFWSSFGGSTWDTLACYYSTDACTTVGTAFGCRGRPYTSCIDSSSPSSLISMCEDNLEGERELCCIESYASYGPTCFVFLQKYGYSSTATNHRCWETDFGQWNGMYVDTDTGSPGDPVTSFELTSLSMGIPASSSWPEPSSPTAPISTTPASPSSAASKPPSLPVGAIVGGAVGGFAVLAAAVCVIVWLVIRGKRRGKDDGAAPETPGPNRYSVQSFVAPPTTPRHLGGYYEPEKYQPVPIADPSPPDDAQSTPPTATHNSTIGEPAELA